MDTAFTFDDVMFKPKYSEVSSRSKVDLSTRIGNLDLKLPIISANMSDITEEKMVKEMFAHGGLGIMHRFMTIEENVKMFQKTHQELMEYLVKSGIKDYTNAKAAEYVGVSIGVGEQAQRRFRALWDAGAKTFCVDVAHGHHLKVKQILEFIYYNGGNRDDITIIAGNVASSEGAIDLFKWGANVVKVGIGPGSCCQTRENTGVGIPQLWILKEIREALDTYPGDIDLKKATIIADGGIKKTGDIAKALKYADAVMVGGFLAGTSETPGHVYKAMDTGQFYKTMAGSASAESKIKGGKEQEFVEGGIRLIPFRGHVKYILREARENVQSSFSYSGASNLQEFRSRSELVKISGGGKKESKF